MKYSDLPVKIQILNIAVNMGRIGIWVADSYTQKKELIDQFLDQTRLYLKQLPRERIKAAFLPTLTRFEVEFDKLTKQSIEENRLIWAEKAITWGNILQARANLA